jgi:ATP-dependent protease ClpP protease subunit
MDREWWRIRNDGSKTARVDIYDEIGPWGIAAKDLVSSINALTAEEIQVHISSPGGDVFDGVAILNALREHKARVVVTVDSVAASAASFIAMGGDEVVMARNSELMIHDAFGYGVGDSDLMRDLADRLDKVSDNIASIYAEKAGGTVEDWRTAMRAETWYSAEEAVAAGLADRVTRKPADVEATNRFDYSIFNFAGRAAAPPPPAIPSITARTTDTPPAGQGQPEKEGAAVTDTAKLREALGLASDASDDEVWAAVDAARPVAPPAASPSNSTAPPKPDEPTPDPDPAPAPPKDAKGTMLVSTSVWEDQQKTIKDLVAFVDKSKRDERDTILAQAVADGKFRPSQLADFRAQWDANPDGTRNLVANLTPNSALAVQAAGYANDREDDSIEAEFAGLFPPTGKVR